MTLADAFAQHKGVKLFKVNVPAVGKVVCVCRDDFKKEPLANELSSILDQEVTKFGPDTQYLDDWIKAMGK